MASSEKKIKSKDNSNDLRCQFPNSSSLDSSWYQDYFYLRDEFRKWDLRARTQEAAIAIDVASLQIRQANYEIRKAELELTTSDECTHKKDQYRYLLSSVKEYVAQKSNKLESLKSELKGMQMMLQKMKRQGEKFKADRHKYLKLSWNALSQVPDLDEETANIITAVHEMFDKYKLDTEFRGNYSHSR